MIEGEALQPKFTFFRIAYKQFIYHGFDLERVKGGFKVTYNFEIPDLSEFHPTWVFPFENADLSDGNLRCMLFNLGMTELVSYWKCCCPPEITVECGSLSEKQVAFYKKLYFNGLGEFFYRNKIQTDFESFVSVSSRGEAFSATPSLFSEGAVIPVGGGKDSVVTLELTKKLQMSRVASAINPHRSNIDTAEIAGFSGDSFIAMRRSISPELLSLNAQGFLNGHTPFSAIVAFSNLIAAYLSGKKYVVLSNEASANEATVGEVNHQYSKSLEFERDFREYVSEFVNCGVEYFSLLRPFAEIRIARCFARFPQYYGKFLSCNLGSKTDSWCGACPKCLFVYLMLLPFTGLAAVNRIFGKCLADDGSLLPDFRSLLGLEKEKPFECVGSVSEARLACEMACVRLENEGRELPLLLKKYREFNLQKPDFCILDSFDKNNFVPEEFLSCLDDRPLSPKEALALEFNGKRVAILGFGREGLSTYRYYRSLFPEADLIIADKKGALLPEEDGFATVVCGKNYLDACRDADLVMISPGIPQFDLPDWLKPKLTSQTRLFLKHFGKQTVGITGTKGKSTCSSLCAAVLPDSLLVGNIGKPVFDSLEEITEDTAVVYELSCHQLENCESSPETAVVTNLFEEHLDHYGSFERYYAAKKNIFKNRLEGELIYDLGNTRILQDELPEGSLTYSVTDKGADIYADYSTGEIKTPQGGISVDLSRLKIKGAHNFGYAAICYYIARKRGVSDGDFLSGLYGFNGLPHRLEFVAEIDGIRFYDDSISTVPQATVAGIVSLGDVGSVIVGGMERSTDLTPLADFLADKEICVILIPETGDRFEELLRERGFDRAVKAGSLEEAVELAKRLTQKNTSCLFSPAAASYHLYKNFEERGRHFKELVLKK